MRVCLVCTDWQAGGCRRHRRHTHVRRASTWRGLFHDGAAVWRPALHVQVGDGQVMQVMHTGSRDALSVKGEHR